VKTKLTPVSSVEKLDDTSMCPNGTCYYYDQNSGLLFINMVQEQPNAGGPYSSPLGACSGSQATSDPACAEENFYSCPGPGCELHTIQANSRYKPGTPSDCTPYGGAGGATDYTQAYPSDLLKLAYASDHTVAQPELRGADTNFPHQEASNPPGNLCPTNAPNTPDWPGPSIIPADFTVSWPSGLSVTVASNPGTTVTPIFETSTNGVYQLAPGNYTLTALSGCADPDCRCEQDFTATSSGWTSASNPNCCQLGTGGSTTIGVANAPYGCMGPNPTPTP
jgi:hypothetical protein